MASLASEIEKLADLKAKGVLTEQEFTHAKAAVIAGDDAADSFEEAGADDDAVPVKSGIGYMNFWSEAFTLLEKFGNIPKDHNLEWRQHLACSKQYDGASLRDGLTSTYETEIIFAALMLGVNWTVYIATVDDNSDVGLGGLYEIYCESTPCCRASKPGRCLTERRPRQTRSPTPGGSVSAAMTPRAWAPTTWCSSGRWWT